MAYSSFTTLRQIKTELDISSSTKKIFNNIKSIEPSNWLKTTLSYGELMESENEKTKSEVIVSPILMELIIRNKDFITVYSGNNLNVDSRRNLNGECDFVITKKKDSSLYIKNPILNIVEAKEHNMKLGIPQCAAQMLGAQIYNKKNNSEISIIYGCVTTGDNWRFLKLVGKELFIDKRKYYLIEIDKILGIFQNIIDKYNKEKNL